MSGKEVSDVHRTMATVAFDEGHRRRDDPNVSAVGYGIKLRGGRPLAGESVVFFVRRKLALTDEIAAIGSVAIPPSIDGYPTDVVEVGNLVAAAADRAPPVGSRGTRIDAPLVGGVATAGLGAASEGAAGYGTLAGHCFDALTRAPLVLSNAHVWGSSAGSEVIQPITASAILGAPVTPATLGVPPSMVQTRIPAGLVAPVAFANSVGQTYLLAGSDSDPLPVGQAATPVAGATRTDSEQVAATAPLTGLPPAGQRLSPVLTWVYQRLASTSVPQSSSTVQRPMTKVLTARRLFTNAASYTGSQAVNLYAEIIPAPGGAPITAGAHHVLVLLYPVATGDKVTPRVLRPTTRQAVTTVSANFAGFPVPARAGAVPLPATAGGFTVDAAQQGTFVVPPGGSGLPAGTFVLALPSGSVRVFVPIGTQVVIDINLTGSSGPLVATAFNSARDLVPATVTTAPGTGGRTLVTVSASEIVEIAIENVAGAQLFGVTSRRSSPEAAPPLAYAGTISAAELTPKGKWGAVLLVQTADLGVPESANIVESAIGLGSLVTDCTFDVA
jgi:hypothetical protein